MGVPVTLSGRLTRAGAAHPAAAGAATVAAGCGSQVATTSSATQPASPQHRQPGRHHPGEAQRPRAARPCAREQASVTRLVVSRVSALPQNHLHFAFPAGITVSSPARARAVAAAVCGLPAMPRGPMSCPADLGVSYRLSFAAGSRSFPVVTAAAGGCAGGGRGRPGALDGPLARVLDGPGPCPGRQRGCRAAGHRPGRAAHQPGAARHRGGQARHQPGSVRPGLAGTACAGRFAEPDTSRKGEHDLGAIRLRRRDLRAPDRGRPGRGWPAPPAARPRTSRRPTGGTGWTMTGPPWTSPPTGSRSRRTWAAPTPTRRSPS